MASMDNIQVALFHQVKSRLNMNLSLVEEIADLLSLSTDSAYRRIRGETALTLDEIKKICNNYHISIDGLLNIKTDSILFNFKWSDVDKFNYSEFLLSMLKDMKYISASKPNEVIFYAKDFPIFYNFLIPEIAAFKSFFWHKTVLQKEEFKNKKFDLNNLNDQHITLGNQIAQAYSQIVSFELWNDEILNSYTSQVLFFHESGYMQSSNTANVLLDRLSELLNHFQIQAETGSKFLYGKEPVHNDNFRLYYNEVLLGDNTIIARSEDKKMTILTHNVINSLATTDSEFCELSWQVHQNIINRSTLISSSSEKERNKFFTRLRSRIDWAKARIQ
jgi:hypothetical protein